MLLFRRSIKFNMMVIVCFCIMFLLPASIDFVRTNVKKNIDYMETEVIQRSSMKFDENAINPEFKSINKKDKLKLSDESILRGTNYRLILNFRTEFPCSKAKNMHLQVFGDQRWENIRGYSTGQRAIIRGRGYSDEEIKNKSKVVVLGDSVAKRCNLDVGDSINLTLADTLEGKTASTDPFLIIGIYNDGLFNNKLYSQYDKTVAAYTPITTMSEILGDESVVSEISYYLKDKSKYDEFKRMALENEIKPDQLVFHTRDYSINNIYIMRQIYVSANVLILLTLLTMFGISAYLRVKVTDEKIEEVWVLYDSGNKFSCIMTVQILENVIDIAHGLILGIVLWKYLSYFISTLIGWGICQCLFSYRPLVTGGIALAIAAIYFNISFVINSKKKLLVR